METARHLAMDFQTPPAIVRTIVEGGRLAYGFLANPTFATETALIDPLPHQLLAVYHHILPQPRLRFLLADDAGAGKTIMTGLYIREQLSRKLISRILVIPPAGLVGNWERELRTLFALEFRILSGGDMAPGKPNPFVGSAGNHVIVSLDTLAGDRAFARLQESAVDPYDLVIFDEAHKLAADRERDLSVRKTGRYRLAESLAGISSDDPRWSLSWGTRHLLLLTATPHMGKDYPYYSLWRLLEPDALSTLDAFNSYPLAMRQAHFIRRTKEEMVDFDERPLYPQRVSVTMSYALRQGFVSEQTLYDRTTQYIETVYNLDSSLNRSAARLAMSVFQRRLASSTYAIRRSFERRLEFLTTLIAEVLAGTTPKEEPLQTDFYDTTTSDEEESSNGQEENEVADADAMKVVVHRSLVDLETERAELVELLDLAHQVEAQSDESKFTTLSEVLADPQYHQEKLIIFTEHRDTLFFLVRRLEGLGFTGQVAQIHGGMDYLERQTQVEQFRRPITEGGAQYLIATDAAGEGINLQFCWIMINYDIPWNPARLEQRMGRIHRYGQQHDPVFIINLIAGSTREGRVMHTLLEKLELIRREMGSDKVFDVIGELFEGKSLRDFLEKSLTEEGAAEAIRALEGTLTSEQLAARAIRDRMIYGEGGEVKAQLGMLQQDRERNLYQRLMPGYVRHYLERALPLLDMAFVDHDDATFAIEPAKTSALHPLAPVLQRYPAHLQTRLTVERKPNRDTTIFVHPGEPIFDTIADLVENRYSLDALRGTILVDPTIAAAYLLHIATLTVERSADTSLPQLARGERVERQLVAVREWADGRIETCPVEQLMILLDGQGTIPPGLPLLATMDMTGERIRSWIAECLGDERVRFHQQRLRATLPEREKFLDMAFSFQEGELSRIRGQLRPKIAKGDTHAQAELTKIKQRQERLRDQRELALATIRRELDLFAVSEIRFITHALVIPSDSSADQRRSDAEVEYIAMQVVTARERMFGALVYDVSTPDGAREAGLPDWPGFDILSRYPDGSVRSIEVKGRATAGHIIMSENEYTSACTLKDRYWLYAVFDCATSDPRLVRVQDPFGKLVAAASQMVISLESILEAAEGE